MHYARGLLLPLVLMLATGASAQSPDPAPGLARQMTWAAYGTTSTGYVQAIAVSNTLRKLYGTSVRVIPGKNDISRIMPLSMKRAQVCACGNAELYFAQDGITLFADPGWGPQPLRLLFTNRGDGVGHGLVMAGDLGIRELADLRGKRVAWVRGSPALQVGTTAILAFAGLEWNDVQRVDVPGYQQGLDAIINNSVDASWASTPASHAQRLAGSPRGALWPVLPHDDNEGWTRLQSIAPHLGKTRVTEGIGIEHNTSGQVPFDGIGVPYPVFVSYNHLPEDQAYALTKAVISNYEDFRNAAPSMEGFGADSQNFRMVLPYHPGAVRYFREIGRWTDADQAHNDTLIERQQVLAAAWAELRASGTAGDGHESAWMALREQRLAEAGFALRPDVSEAAGPKQP